MNERSEKRTYKIIMVGNSEAGKTSLCTKYCCNVFTDSSHTIGVSFMTKGIQEENIYHKLNIWDTAGQERFNSIIKLYFKNINGAICMYDVTNIDSLKDTEKWINEIYEFYDYGKKPKIIIVGNKIDLLYKNIKSFEERKKKFMEQNRDYIDYLKDKFKILDHVIISCKYEPISFIYEKLYKNINDPIISPLEYCREIVPKQPSHCGRCIIL